MALPRRPRILPSLLVLALSASAAHAALLPCREARHLRPLASPNGAYADLSLVPANGVACVDGAFLALPEGGRLWRCAAQAPDGQDLPEDAPEHAFLLERPGQPLVAMPDSLMAGRLRSFEVIEVDIDGDGKKERILAAWNAQGNGIGVNSWTIRVFDASWTLLRQFDEVSDWGDSSLVAAPKGRRGCDIAVTGFVESQNARGREGISFEARFHALVDGKLVAATDRPVLQRRYDKGFERERTTLFERSEARGAPEIKGDVRGWLSHRRTTAVTAR